MRVVAVDGRPCYRHGLKAVAAVRDDLVIVGTADCLADARELLACVDCDVVVAAELLSDGLALSLLECLRHEAVPPRLLILAEHPTASVARHARRCGARGLLASSVADEDLVRAIFAIADGQTAGDLSGGDAATRPAFCVSPRQAEIIRLLARGRSNDEIGGALGIAAKTVETQLSRLYDRLGLQGRIELLGRALDAGLVEPTDLGLADDGMVL